MLGNASTGKARVRSLAGGVLILGVLAGCGGGAASAQDPTGPVATPVVVAPPVIPAPEESPAPEPSATATTAWASPLTGLPKGEGKPVLIVKLDNTRQAQPHAGLRDADVVYVEEVEYGLTRLAAVFSSALPDEVGPVRSARITDIDLFAPYEHPAFAYSGAQHKLLPVIAKSDLIDVSGLSAGGAYWRESGRRAPYDLFADPAELLHAAGGPTSTARDLGFTFSTEPPSGGTPATRLTATWLESTVAFRYDPDAGTYAVWFDGSPARAAEGGGQHAATVVIQYVKQTDSGYHDKFGGRTPLAHTVGAGKAVILRDGRAYDATWSRADEASGTTFTDTDGQPVPFRPGQQWIVLVDRTKPVEIG